MKITRNDIRNIAIIAHVDHGKTTLVDEMLKQGGVFRENQQVAERVMDSNDLERERGITILSKNTAVHYGGVKINIVDTPGHADFSGEVERVLKMVGGVLAAGGRLRRPHAADPLCAEKGAGTQPAGDHRHQQGRPARRAQRAKWRMKRWNCSWSWTPPTNSSTAPSYTPPAARDALPWIPMRAGEDLRPLFDTILSHIPAPEGDPDAPLQMLISTIDYNDYVGRIGVGRIERGAIQRRADGRALRATSASFTSPAARLGGLYEFDGLKRVPCDRAQVGDIVAVCGFRRAGHRRHDLRPGQWPSRWPL